MIKKTFTLLFSLFLLFLLKVEPIKAQAAIDLESGLVITGYNDVRIPGDQGTFFSLKDDLIPDPKIFVRLRVNYTIKSRHTISLLYAPLKTISEGSISGPVTFEGVVFPENTELTGNYKFNSYRLTYRYKIVQRPKFEFGVGFTAKIRDAYIELKSSDLVSVKTNVGFVPIINFRLMWQPGDAFGILFEGDALAAPQGRAEDVIAAATYKISDKLTLKAGYRLLEGGADNDEVYSFAMFHYATAGLIFTFGK